MTIRSEVSIRHDMQEEARLQLCQDVARAARRAAVRLNGNWPSSNLPKYTNPRLAPVCFVGTQHILLGDDGGLYVICNRGISRDRLDYTKLNELQLSDIQSVLDTM